jgi:microsomal dipeptidase-like Zn-dependent dipeptidase
VIRWRQSETTGETIQEKVITMQFARANNRILAGDYTALATTETEKDLELKKEAEQKKIVVNGQGPQPFGDVVGQLKSMCYTEGISCTKQANDSCLIDFRY